MNNPMEHLARKLEELAAQVRATPPFTYQIDERNALVEIDPAKHGKAYRQFAGTTLGQTTITIRWLP